MLTHWIGGKAVPSAGGDGIEVLDPATGRIIEEIPRGTAEDVDQAVAAARDAAPAWAALTPPQRRAALLQAAGALRAERDRFARLLVEENGKPLREALAEVDAAAGVTASYAELAVHARSGAQQGGTGELNFQYRQPRGVAACIVPWNFPVAVGVENLAPNLAVGNAVVIKPSEKTPLATRELVERAFGHLPPGTCNVLLGDGPSAGDHLISHAQVDVVVFVGSERTGRHIAEVCGRDLRKAVVELGGKDAFIVDDTVDLAQAVALAKVAKYTASGQICTSPERFFVTGRVFEPFVEELTAASRAMRLGPGADEGTDMGPLIDQTQRARVTEHVATARSAGATVHCGGEPVDGPGFFFPPTVITNADTDLPVMTDETFGPVAPVVRVADFDEAIERANDSRFGLSAMVCTESAPRAMLALERLRAGMIKINTNRGKAPGATSEPFNASGLGHGYGVEFLHELSREKSVHWRSHL
ncbi:aldehyde dehydrogenase family protein [Phytoactinopolyspora halotolerans]|uniref:Aldehyde dehydrogenase n=1 Tax=Phytoactinopolyspora halotolerans TaxID=1981512 RepID=A0A6L9SD79_9ACTN|nr:aldehyde dehydrogenase family protein [Phytoactinopolyspora halotolerans]NEE03335.1 aldehyde dehydrogenase [Phytoactinopolyspora halotolerans]